MKTKMQVVFVLLVLLAEVAVHGLSSASTVAVIYGTGSGTVCGIVSGESTQSIQCVAGGGSPSPVPVTPNVSFDSVSGGRNFFCGLRSGGLQFFCWDGSNSTVYAPRRVYNGSFGPLTNLSVGDNHVCAVNGTGDVHCWGRGTRFPETEPGRFQSVVSAGGFSCGVAEGNGTVRCWGNGNISDLIETGFGNASMVSLVAGESHACGVSVSGSVICSGRNESGQLAAPPAPPFELSSFALEANRSCAIRRSNGALVCWGGVITGTLMENYPKNESFEAIVAGNDFTCGLATSNLSVICWGSNSSWFNRTTALSLPKIIPGACTDAPCICGAYLDYVNYCSGSRKICRLCNPQFPPPPPSPPPIMPPLQPPSPPPPPTRNRRRVNRGLLAFAIVGGVGSVLSIITIIYWLWTGICCCKHNKIHNSVQPTITTNVNPTAMSLAPLSSLSRSSTFRRQSSRAMRRQRSGTSSKHADRAEEFTLSELAAATDNFSPENKLGAGSFGTVYRGKLVDGREVAIKRGETGPLPKKFQEKEKTDEGHLSMRAAGTVGYMDPEYYGLHHLTAKSDVYGLGVVLLEVLTGRRAIFKDEEADGGPISVVDYAVPRIMGGELTGILDARVGMPEMNEAEAVELVAYTAVHCVNLEGKERPSMTDIVANLERALTLCETSHGSISSAGISLASD
ncbi:hypothetical protein MRB53_004007 [Persea americana]|uniref:Uncharacterized protein n=1 Tax=Persea americana TaxID=3435 RepID=A0ACC2N0S3_PERAE|nr:hypothetical protein MRB53_004007 [Persea americana]